MEDACYFAALLVFSAVSGAALSVLPVAAPWLSLLGLLVGGLFTVFWFTVVREPLRRVLRRRGMP